MKLCIVESPGKVNTIQKYLGPEFRVKASIGHCFQIEPKDGAIDIENNYEPHYVIIPKKKAVVDEIKKIAKTASDIYICTDADREGENIGYSIAKFGLKNLDVKRATFQEITKTAVLAAINNPRKIDMNMVFAQKARSVLDFLVGFKVSPVLWRKVCKGTSAGRVQSIGLKIIVERQKEINNFKTEEYWDIAGQFSTIKNQLFVASYKSEEKLVNEEQVNKILDTINKAKQWSITSLSKTKKKRSPQPLFTTSSLQQFCSNSFGWDGKHTMSIAQKLYEGFSIAGKESTGLITYHRTDSVNISNEAIENVRQHISKIGSKYLPLQPRIFKSKASAQEAHEGIRPAHLEFSLDDVRASVDDNEFKLYEAIYYKFISCQMTDAEFDSVKVIIDSDNNQTFTANGQTLAFDGYLKCWPYSDIKEEILPSFNEKEKVTLTKVDGSQHFTKPPACFNTASLVKTLEEQGIGRPSTYATIVDTLIKRGYVDKNGKAFIPTELGTRISDFLVVSFPELMNPNYTARIEGELDEIAEHGKVWYEVVDSFFKELSKRLSVSKEMQSQKGETTEIVCPVCKKFNLVKRFSKYGPCYGCDGYKSKECHATFKIGADGEPLLQVKKEVKYLEGVVCDKCGAPIAIRKGIKSGKEFGGCSTFPKCRRMFNMDGSPMEFKSKFGKKGKKGKKKEAKEDE